MCVAAYVKYSIFMFSNFERILLMRDHLIIFQLLLTFVSVKSVAAEQTVPLYTYYTDPPFFVSLEHNKTTQLADWLTQKASGRYRFQAIYLPRRRLNFIISQPNWQGVVAWANPSWFDDNSQSLYLWSRPFMQDIDLIASNRNKPIDFENSDSLNGLVFGGILGRRYHDFDLQVNQGKFRREDTVDIYQNLQKLKAGRIDVILLQGSNVSYLRQIYPDLDQWLYIAPKPRAVIQRHLFTNAENRELMSFLNKQLRAIAHDPQWKESLQFFVTKAKK